MYFDVLRCTSLYFTSVQASPQPLPANKMQIGGIAAASELFLRNPQDLLLNSCKLGDVSIFTQNHFDHISINAFQHLSRLEPWKALHFKDMCLFFFGLDPQTLSDKVCWVWLGLRCCLHTGLGSAGWPIYGAFRDTQLSHTVGSNGLRTSVDAGY